VSRALTALQALLPRGRAWTRAVGTRLTSLLEAIACEFDRLEARAADLLRESVPSDADERLPDWEAITDAARCVSGASLVARRGAVIARLNPETPTEAALIRAIEGMGYASPDLDYFQAFQVGRSTVGDPLTNDEWQHAVQITVSSISAEDDAALECVVFDLLHLHIIPFFIYGTPAGFALVTEGGDHLITEGGDRLVTE